MTTKPPAASSSDASPIIAHRRTRGSVPLSADLFNATTNPDVIAFQTTVLFHDPHSGPLTLPQLQRRWNLSGRRATAARKTLIDSGFWAQLDARQPGGTFARTTVFSETRLSVEELSEIAIQYPPSSLLRCGGTDYLIGTDGVLTDRVGTSGSEMISAGRTEDAQLHGRREQEKQDVSAGRTEPAHVQARSVTADRATEAAKLRTRREQESSNTEDAQLHGRREQEKQDVSAGRTEPAHVQADACSSSSLREDDEKKHACMDVLLIEFWQQVSSSVAVVDPRGRSSVTAQVRTALSSGWTPKSLTDWIGRQLAKAQSRTTVRSPGGFVISQLREIPAVTETTGPDASKPDLPDWCGECGDPSDPRREFKCTNNLRARVWPDGTPCSCRTDNSSAA